MLTWLKRYLPALVLLALLLVLLDGVLSSLLTCHPISTETSGGHDTQKQQECTALAGPVLVSLTAIVDFADGHGDAITGVFTIALAIFTARLWFSTEKLWGVTNQSVELARKEFISSHRPRMRLKHIWMTDGSLLRNDDTTWQNGPLEFNLDIVNIGNTDGYITWINFESVLLPPGQRLPQRPPYDEVPAGPADTRTSRFRNNALIGPGLTFTRQVCDGRILDPGEVQSVLSGQWRLYLVGTIEYYDFIPVRDGVGNLGALRQTAFCRRMTFTNYPPTAGDFGRFEIEKDRDYEYEEWGD